MYLIQPYETKCGSDLLKVTGFLFVLIFSLPMVRCTRYNLMKQCGSDLRNVTGFLFVLIFVTSHGQVYSVQPYEKSVSVTCGMLLVFSLYLYFHFLWSGVLDITL